MEKRLCFALRLSTIITTIILRMKEDRDRALKKHIQRKKYKSSLDPLYNESYMPDELRDFN